MVAESTDHLFHFAEGAFDLEAVPIQADAKGSNIGPKCVSDLLHGGIVASINFIQEMALGRREITSTYAAAILIEQT